MYLSEYIYIYRYMYVFLYMYMHTHVDSSVQMPIGSNVLVPFVLIDTGNLDFIFAMDIRVLTFSVWSVNCLYAPFPHTRKRLLFIQFHAIYLCIRTPVRRCSFARTSA